MWNTKHIELGTLKVGKEVKVKFKMTRVIKGMIIDKLESSCGCSIPKWDPATGTVTVTYKPKDIPKHLLAQGKDSYITTKRVKVISTNIHQRTDELTFRSTIVK